jgi:hypothetical protein
MHTPQVITHGVDYVFLIVPVVVVLFGWIGACYWADAHPDVRHVGRVPGPAISGETGGESTLAAGAADENQGAAGERIAAGDETAPRPEAARSGETGRPEETGGRGQT